MGRKRRHDEALRHEARGYRYKAWQTMRVLRKNGTTWTRPELAALCECAVAALQDYIGGLVRHGYVEVARAQRKGRRGGHARYRLARDTGPRAPRVRCTGALYDGNLDRVIPPEGGR